MTVTLGGVILSDHLALLGIENSPGVAWSAQRTLGGAQKIEAGPTLTGGRQLALQSDNHLTLTQIESIKELEALGQSVSLVHHRGTFTVFITGIEVEPDTIIADPDDAEMLWYSGQINLIEV